MKKIFFLSISFILMHTISFSQKKEIRNNEVKSCTEWKSTYVGNKEKKVKESYTIYTANGEVAEEYTYDEFGKVKTHIVYKYDSDDNKISEIHYTPDGQLKKTIKYTYKEGLKTERAVYDKNGNLVSKKIFEFKQQ